LPKKRHFTNPDLRLLDQEVIALKQRVEDLEKLIAARAAVRYSEPQVRVDIRDQAAHEATQEVAEALSPDKHIIKHFGKGRFQVLFTPTMEAVHDGWLTKAEAKVKLEEMMGARGD
jgi:hypothetical protein